MQINMGNFGNVVAKPEQQIQLPAGTGQETSQALGNLAQQGQHLIHQFQAIDEQKQRMQAASSLASLNNDLHDIHDSVSRDVAEGVIKPENAIDAYNNRAADAKKARTDGLAPSQLEAIDSHIIGTTGALTRNLQGVAIKRTQADIGTSIYDTGETLQRAAMRDLPGSIAQYDGMVETMGPKAGWDPVHIAKVKQGFKESATYEFANATLEGAAQTGDISLVRAAREKLQGQDGEVIDQHKRTALITKAYAYENGIEAQTQRDAEKAAREQEARENAAVDTYNKYFDLMSRGRYLSTEAISEAAMSTAGTKMAGPMQELVKSQASAAGFASLPLKQQAAALERMRAAGSDPAIGVTPLEQKTQEQFQTIYDAGVKAYKENPWQAAQERAVIKDAPVINMNNMQDAQQVIADRMRQIGQVEVAAGRKISPLQPQEADQIGRFVRMLPPDQQASALAGIGTALQDADRVAALAKQVHDKDSSLGLAMMLANDKTTQGRYASELLIRGERALKDKSIQVDNMRESGWKGQIAKEVGDAFPNQEVRQQVLESAYMINAGIVSEGGGSDPSRAVRLAAGRIVEHNGSNIPLPRGMEESDFNKRIKAIVPADIATQTTDNNVYVGRTPLPVETFIKQLPDASLVHAGPGRYNVKAGGGLVTNSLGNRITIKVSP